MEKRQLSEIKGEGTLSAFAEIVDPLFNMAEDPETLEMYRQEFRPENVSRRSYTARQAYKILASHEDDFCKVMAICYGTTAAEYRRRLTYTQALADFSELITDDVWQNFFYQAAHDDTETSSGSAPESTGA